MAARFQERTRDAWDEATIVVNVGNPQVQLEISPGPARFFPANPALLRITHHMRQI